MTTLSLSSSINIIAEILKESKFQNLKFSQKVKL